jgi:hypothetical protein
VIRERLFRIVAMRGQLVLQFNDRLFECRHLELDRIHLGVGLALVFCAKEKMKSKYI